MPAPTLGDVGSGTGAAFGGMGLGAGAVVTSSSDVEFGVLDLVVSTALSTGKTLDAAMSKTGGC